MKCVRSALCALGCLFVLTSSAFADVFVDYTLTAGTDTISFSLPQFPAVQGPPCVFIVGTGAQECVTIFPVSLTVDGSSFVGDVKLFDQSAGGGLTICTGATCIAGSTALVNNNGPGIAGSPTPPGLPLFTGPIANPELETFSNLLLVGEPGGSPIYNESFTLTAVAIGSATPEPGSYAALILCFGGIMLVVRSRRAEQRG
jgi:hypothetical protein